MSKPFCEVQEKNQALGGIQTHDLGFTNLAPDVYGDGIADIIVAAVAGCLYCRSILQGRLNDCEDKSARCHPVPWNIAEPCRTCHRHQGSFRRAGVNPVFARPSARIRQFRARSCRFGPRTGEKRVRRDCFFAMENSAIDGCKVVSRGKELGTTEVDWLHAERNAYEMYKKSTCQALT